MLVIVNPSENDPQTLPFQAATLAWWISRVIAKDDRQTGKKSKKKAEDL